MAFYRILPEQLDEFVHKKARPGDLAMTYDIEKGKHYWYICTTDNIGKHINPAWEADENHMRTLLNMQFNNMLLEEKVNFLINNYIEENVNM